MRGDPRCSLCHGAGGIRASGVWLKCSCVIVDARTRAANKRAAEVRTGNAPLTMDDMIRMGGSERRGQTDGA